MRSAFVTFFCAIGLVVSGGTGTRADEKEDAKKELKKFEGVWKIESMESGGKNRSSYHHWLFLTDATVTANGRPVIERGALVVP